jgi:glycosyltransferase involved in cell wall biosynthesis
MEMMNEKSLNILAPARYPWRFNGPRNSSHNISVRKFLPFNYISRKLEGVTVYNPLPLRHFDIIHAFNRIPIGMTPFLIGFESHLPRAFGMEGTVFCRKMREILASDRCRAIVAISEFAKREFLRQHSCAEEYDTLKAKLQVRSPNLAVAENPGARDKYAGREIRLLFVGSHFGRKGGSVAVRMAEIALRRNIPLLVDVVSDLQVGATSWTDPIMPGYFDGDIALLKLPNVRYHGRLPNKAVLNLITQAHFALLPTFSDSFGYSAIEAMAVGTPVIATAQAALPEFIRDGQNGILLPLATDQFGEWIHCNHRDRASLTYAKLHREEIGRLAELAVERVLTVTADPKVYYALRREALATAEALFSADAANEFWDNFYRKLVR